MATFHDLQDAVSTVCAEHGYEVFGRFPGGRAWEIVAVRTVTIPELDEDHRYQTEAGLHHQLGDSLRRTTKRLGHRATWHGEVKTTGLGDGRNEVVCSWVGSPARLTDLEIHSIIAGVLRGVYKRE